MSKIKKGHSTLKQAAYAKRIFTADGIDKKSIALDVGYSPNVARSVTQHIEEKAGFHNAMAKLAYESNNLALAAMHEFHSRGFETFSNQDMIRALEAISGAWQKFSAPIHDLEKSNNASTNKLRTVILQQIENNTNIVSDKPVIEQVEKPNLDF